MFCTHCGAKVPEGANFCVGCGTKVGAGSPVAPPPLPSPPPRVEPRLQRPPQPPPVAATSKCVWCAAVVTGSDTSCPRCGAALRVDRVVTESGWAELPGRKDMAKLHFGNSSCQIEGVYVPVADMNLAAGERVYFTHHVLLWKEPRVNITTMSLAGAWKRMFAGMPLIMMQAEGPGHIAFSKDDPGELIPVPLQAGEEVDVREHLFLAATGNVEYNWFQTGIWFTTKKGDESETHYPLGGFMDRFSAPQTPGLLMLHAAGNVFVRQLAPGQTILVKPTALVFKDPAVQMHLHFEQPGTVFRGWGSWGNRYIWLRLIGPGRVAVQSVFDRIEGESRNISGFSYATEQRW